MKIGFDYWQVISHFPDQCSFMASAFISEGAKVHVISAVGKNRVGSVAPAIEKLGFHWDADTFVHEVIFDNPSQSPELKIAKALELGIDIFFDDRDDVCRAMNKAGIMACRVSRKDNSTYDLGAERV